MFLLDAFSLNVVQLTTQHFGMVESFFVSIVKVTDNNGSLGYGIVTTFYYGRCHKRRSPGVVARFSGLGSEF